MPLLSDGERLEPLSKTLSIVVSDAHRFSTDSLLLASFAGVKKHDTICDLGTGCGILPLLWCKGETGPITAVDIQKDACALLQKSLAHNGLSDRVQVLHHDLRDLSAVLQPGSFSLVTMNPPYTPLGSGAQSETQSGSLARHETMCSLDEVAAAAAKLLRHGGRFCLCLRPERLSEAVVTLHEQGLELKRMRFAAWQSCKAPWLVLLEARKGARAGVCVEPLFFLKNDDGTDTAEAKALYGDYMLNAGWKGAKR